MNFFEAQHQARRESSHLVLLFGLAVFAIVVVIDLTAILGYRFFHATHPAESSYFQQVSEPSPWSDPELQILSLVTLITLLVIAGGSAWRIQELNREGSEAIARLVGATRIDPDTAEPDYQRLLNVIEEMAIAAGCNVPTVWVMTEVTGVNAFAAGYSPLEAAIVVSRGCLTKLDRDELQGVIAHEFSHIFNGDMRTNIKMLGVLHGILVIGLTGKVLIKGLARTRSRSRRKGSGAEASLLGAGVALFVIGYLGVFFGRWIKASLSRSREYLADASAVQFTRNPRGIAGALKKIHDGIGSTVRANGAEQLSHFYFADGIGFHSPIFSTHPVLTDRLDKILPDWKTSLPETKIAPIPSMTEVLDKITAQRLQQSIGDPTPAQLTQAVSLLDSVPSMIRGLTITPRGAEIVLYALLQIEHPNLQIELMQAALEDFKVPSTLVEAHRIIRTLGEKTWLPIANLCAPSLQQLNAANREKILQRAEAITHADDHLTDFEATVLALLERTLASNRERKRHEVRKLDQIRTELVSLCAILARAGSDDRSQVTRAFRRGLDTVGMSDDFTGDVPHTASNLLPHLISPIARATPRLKETVMRALTEVAVSDGEMNTHESELLRAISGTLECPMPLIS